MMEYVPVSSLEASSITKKCLVPSHLTRYLERTPVGTSTPFFILKEKGSFKFSHVWTHSMGKCAKHECIHLVQGVLNCYSALTLVITSKTETLYCIEFRSSCSFPGELTNPSASCHRKRVSLTFKCHLSLYICLTSLKGLMSFPVAFSSFWQSHKAV